METNTQQNKSELLLNWTASIRQEHTRGIIWYICAIIVIVLLITYSLITSAWTFTFVIILFTTAYFYFHRESVPKITIEIQKTGIKYGDTFTPIASCDGFWILKAQNYNELHIERNKGKQKDIVISVEQTDIQKLRTVLTELMPELINKNEKLFDKIIRICKL